MLMPTTRGFLPSPSSTTARASPSTTRVTSADDELVGVPSFGGHSSFGLGRGGSSETTSELKESSLG
jgi:hypothetical protein